MSRIGNFPVSIPNGLEVKICDNKVFASKGNISESYSVPEYIQIKHQGSKLYFQGSCKNSFLGLYRSKVNNFISGIDKQFEVILDIKGVGYRANLSGVYLTLFLGFSHSIKYRVPPYLTIKVEKPTEILMYALDKDKLGMIAYDICNIRKYDPYKKKGITQRGRYVYTKEINKK